MKIFKIDTIMEAIIMEMHSLEIWGSKKEKKLMLKVELLADQ